MFNEVIVSTCKTYSVGEIVRQAVIFALTLPRDGHPVTLGWDERLHDIVDGITAPARSGSGSSADEPEPMGKRYPGVWRDVIISLEDGCAYRQLYSHLRDLGLTPQEYRQKWGLPEDYPMMAEDEKGRRGLATQQDACKRRFRGRPRKRRD
jgi:predicted transcriptional regulator